jgi:DNA-binding SARP family transcriptional activator
MDAGGRGEVVLEILGPFRAWRGDSEVRVGAAKVRALASALALFAPERLTTEDLLEAIWGANPPATAKKALQTYVVRLRKLFGSDAVRTDVAGYALPSALCTDKQQFEELLAPARSTPRRASVHDAGAAATALTLWRGDPCPDLDWARATGAVRRLEGLRAHAQEIVAESHAWSDEPAKWVTDLARLVEEAPLREKRWQLLMIALYRSGRQSEALRAYQRARALLVEEIGVEPGRELRGLEAAILRHDDALAAGVRDDAASWEHDLQVGDEARRKHEYDTAIAAYRRALAVGERSDNTLARECEVLIRLAESEYLAGDPARRATGVAAARLADHLGDRELLVRAALAGSRQIEAAFRRVDPDRVELLRRAVDATTTPSDRARVLAVLASELNASPDHTERRKLSDTALGLARVCGDAATLHQVLAARFASIQAPDTLAERLSKTAEDLAVVAGLDDLRSRWGALSNRATACLEAGDAHESERADAAAAEIADRLGVPAMRWRAQFIEARRLTWHGELVAAARQARAARKTGEAAGEDAAYLYQGQLYVIMWDQGRLPEIGGALGSMPLERPLDRAFVSHAYAHLAQTRQAQGLLMGLAARAFADLAYDGRWLTAMALVADAAARVAAGHIVEEVYELLVPWRDQIVVSPTTCLGTVTHYLGMLANRLGRTRDADDAFADASEIHERMNAPIWTARTRLEWGRSLITRNPGRADAQLALANRVAQAHGARAILVETAALRRHPHPSHVGTSVSS